MKKWQQIFSLTSCLAMCMIVFSCSDNEEGKNGPSVRYTVSGKVEKGPFVAGSPINMQTMDAKLQPTGKNFTVNIVDDAGNFNFGSQEFDTPYAKLTASGYFFNEVVGDLSQGTLNLNAVVDLSDKQTINVNILTHLKYDRIIKLISSQGKSFKEANKQAQKELLSAFGLQRYADTDASQFSITAGTDEAGALIAISSLILANRTEAEITEYLARLSRDFANSGSFSGDIVQQIKEDRGYVSYRLEMIAEHIKERYEELGQNVQVKDLAYYFDWNDDGIAGNEVAEEGDVSLSEKTLAIPAEGGKYTIEITSSIPVTLTLPSTGGTVPDVEQSFGSLYENNASFSIKYQAVIENNTLKITVDPSLSRKESYATIPLYDYRGKSVAILDLTQAGNPNAAFLKLGERGKEIMLNFAESLSRTLTLSYGMDCRYTGIINDDSFHAPLSPYDQRVSQSWLSFYSTIKINRMIYKADTEQLQFYQELLNTYNALLYYNMVTYWGDVPYVTTVLDFTDNLNLSRTAVSTIFASFVENLNAAIEALEEKKNVAVAEDANDVLFISKDVARIILADIYMYSQQYAEAKALLEKVVSNTYYALETAKEYTKDSKELILARYADYGTRSSEDEIIPILTYSDVLLSLAECENYLSAGQGKSRLEEVTIKKGITVSQGDVKTGIKEARKQLKLPNYWAFLKRTGLAESELSLEKYQLLFPIPQREVDFVDNIIQNEGYNK